MQHVFGGKQVLTACMTLILSSLLEPIDMFPCREMNRLWRHNLPILFPHGSIESSQLLH